MDLRNKVALVTGSAHRVGKSIAVRLAEGGAHIVVHYHTSEARARAAADELRGLGVRALAVAGDLAQPADIEAVFRAAEAEFGGVDILVNSAAIMESADVLQVTRDDWRRTMDLNLAGPFFCAQQAARSMQARGGGAIVNIADLAGFKPWATYPVHSISKAGLVMLTKVLAKALAPAIRVNAVAPGPVIKPPEWTDERWQALGARTLLKRIGSGYDVAQAVAFLVEQEYITGETIVVDGGSLHA